tara:strand:+ start:157680 stop:159377 length:1698 start_codon:yes stop_codon:yes gene_type:complete
MKKLIYIFLLAIIGVSFSGCTPMDDIHEEIDADLNNNSVQGAIDYTLTEDDYTALDLGYGSFNSLDDAKTMIPGLLTDVFPILGSGSLVSATFNLYSPVVVENYTVTAADYSAIGLSNEYFSSQGEITSFLKYQFPQAKTGMYANLTYNTLADEIAYTIDADGFDIIGTELGDVYPEPASSASSYNNFDRREGRDAYWSPEMIVDAINAVLSENFDGITGQKYNVSYAIYDGSAGTESTTVQFDGNAYVAVGGMSYQFGNADFALIGTELGTAYPEPAASAANYNNFDRREGNAAYWSQDMILEAINVILPVDFPAAAEGDKFEVSYAIYNGAAGVEITSVVLTDGVYVLDTEASISTIETTTTYAYIANAWTMPYALTSEDYTEMGQSYPNFSDRDEATYKIGVFLESLYPYAEEGDYAAVTYDYYSSGVTTQYTNFVFEGGSWNFVPSVIESSLQFGNDGTTWIPDNTIKYTLTNADYEYMADTLGADPAYAGIVATLRDYHDYDSSWTTEQILYSLFVLAEHNFPSAEIGQKYEMSYLVYNNGLGEYTASIILTADGWAVQE